MNKPYWKDRPLEEEIDRFHVSQFAPSTFLEGVAGLDYVRIAPSSRTEIHRHVDSDNIIVVTEGAGTALLNDEQVEVQKGDRVVIGRGCWHGFVTGQDALVFVSIQMPPILDKARGLFDREVRTKGN